MNSAIWLLQILEGVNQRLSIHLYNVAASSRVSKALTLRKKGWNDEVEIIFTVLTSYHIVTKIWSLRGKKEKKIFHNNFIILAASGRWTLITSWFAWRELFKLVQTREHQRIPDRLADCWITNSNMASNWKVQSFFPDCGCGFINLWLPSLSDMLCSCSMLDLFESDCTLSEETDHVKPSCDAQQVELLIRGLFDRNIYHVMTAEPVTPQLYFSLVALQYCHSEPKLKHVQKEQFIPVHV